MSHAEMKMLVTQLVMLEQAKVFPFGQLVEMLPTVLWRHAVITVVAAKLAHPFDAFIAPVTVVVSVTDGIERWCSCFQFSGGAVILWKNETVCEVASQIGSGKSIHQGTVRRIQHSPRVPFPRRNLIEAVFYFLDPILRRGDRVVHQHHGEQDEQDDHANTICHEGRKNQDITKTPKKGSR